MPPSRLPRPLGAPAPHRLATALAALALMGSALLTAIVPLPAEAANHPKPGAGAKKPAAKGNKGAKAAKNPQGAKGSKAAKKQAGAKPKKGSKPPPPSAKAPPPSTPAPTLAECQGERAATVLKAMAEGSEAGHAQAVTLDRAWLRWPGPAAPDGRYVLVADGQPLPVGQTLSLVRVAASLPAGRAPADLLAQQPHLAPGVDLQMNPVAQLRWSALLRGPLQLVEIDPAGAVRRHTGLQTGALLDDLFGAADGPDASALGATPGGKGTAFALWAPTAQRVNVCLHAPGQAQAGQLVALARDDATGIFSAQASGVGQGWTYRYLVDVQVPGVGMVRNRVTDPYSVSLTANSQRSWVGDLDSAALQPPGWATAKRPAAPASNTDLVVYELHPRDFSVGDDRVPAALRGKYLAFTQPESHGMRHLRALAQAGVTDVHLLPVFDLATVPEQGCSTPTVPAAAPNGREQQAAVKADAARDCYNWGYDPLHFGAPEGSYATDAEDGAVRVREFRRMVMALNAAGLRVGMDMVYNHTSASGQAAQSVLDRIVPGYYQRLNAQGAVETSTCCANTATERKLMARLMVDTAVRWVRDYRIDSIRFDLMGHQPRAAMLRLQTAVDAAAGQRVHLIGEGWNFGEVKDGARFVQAAQGRLDGTRIATFNDRLRDALRGGGCCDNTPEAVARPGWLNGLAQLPADAPPPQRAALAQAADLVRGGLGGTLRELRLPLAGGATQRFADVDYAGGPAGYGASPEEVVNYAENHDDRTLFDTNALKLPADTPRAERARVQVLGVAATLLAQGVPYVHAGVELLRSKSGDRNSYDSGDHFNRIDWTAQTNFWGAGLPPEADNGALWGVWGPLLADARIAPAPADIAWTRDAVMDLLRIRASSRLFRLRTADEVLQRLRYPEGGVGRGGATVAVRLDGRGLDGARFAEVVYALNAHTEATVLTLPELKGAALQLHPVHRAPGAADRRPADEARWDPERAELRVPARTAVVWVRN